MKKALLLFAALALLVAACGGSDDDSAAALPINDNTDAAPALDATCLVGEPDCNDTPGGEPTDLPPPGDDVVDGDGMVVDGGLTITEALESDSTGTIAVRGFVVAVNDQVQLCEALAESFPPQCGGASLQLDGLDQIDPEELKTEGDVTWTDLTVTVFGEVNDGMLIATPISQ